MPGEDDWRAAPAPRVLGPDRPAWLPQPQPQHLGGRGAAAGGNRDLQSTPLEAGREAAESKKQKQAVVLPPTKKPKKVTKEVAGEEETCLMYLPMFMNLLQ